ncbi:MAG: divalent-cation tolerance protein CutA [Comamonadaceae bacterium]|nr:divalent-cation tolerance protein CutA [Comamonadaceae bacterium]
MLTTLPAEADAGAFGEALVNERLAACVSIGAEMTSVYAWKGAVERARERQLLVKTVMRRTSRSSRPGLATLHPYDVPELLVLAVADGGEALPRVGARVHRRLSYHPCETHDTDRDARARPFRSRSAGG